MFEFTSTLTEYFTYIANGATFLTEFWLCLPIELQTLFTALAVCSFGAATITIIVRIFS